MRPFDALLDIVINDELRTTLWPPPAGDDDAHWAIRASAWDDDDVLMAGSDAGAHLDRMCGGSYPTQFLAECLRGRKFMSIEQAIHNFTDKPARLFGLRDRGRVAEGAFADLVLFDPETVGAEPARLVHDLPGGAVRLVAGSTGVQRVFVNGVETIRDGESTGATPGTVLRSGTRHRHRHRPLGRVATSGRCSLPRYRRGLRCSLISNDQIRNVTTTTKNRIRPTVYAGAGRDSAVAVSEWIGDGCTRWS